MIRCVGGLLWGALLSVVVVSAAEVGLIWQDNSSNEAGFRLERAIGVGGGFIPISTVAADVTAATDTTAPENALCRYRVQAFNSVGSSAYSNIAEVTTRPAETLPDGAPGGLEGQEAAPASKLVNVSARAELIAGSTPLIGGFVIEGTEPLTVLLRGVGPTLGNHGVGNALVNPRIELIGVAGASNEEWSLSIEPDAEAIAAAAAQVGAFPLVAGSKDAALLRTLPPGAYTVHVTSVDGGAGVALFEAYEVAPVPSSP